MAGGPGERLTSGKWGGTVGRRYTVSWADGFPILLASAASLRHFNAQLAAVDAQAAHAAHVAQAAGEQPHTDISIRRFRPNIVIDACPSAGAGAALEPFAEDAWHVGLDLAVCEGATVAASGAPPRLRLRVAKPCMRCTVPDIDPDTGARGTGPTAGRVARCLRGYRTGARLGFTRMSKDFAKETFFGQNCVVLEGDGGAAAGDDGVPVLGRVMT